MTEAAQQLYVPWVTGLARLLKYQQATYLSGASTSPHPYLNRFPLPNGEHVSCVFWNELYHITGTDIGEHRQGG